jgi:hypothetical protein
VHFQGKSLSFLAQVSHKKMPPLLPCGTAAAETFV